MKSINICNFSWEEAKHPTANCLKKNINTKKVTINLKKLRKQLTLKT